MEVPIENFKNMGFCTNPPLCDLSTYKFEEDLGAGAWAAVKIYSNGNKLFTIKGLDEPSAFLKECKILTSEKIKKYVPLFKFVCKGKLAEFKNKELFFIICEYDKSYFSLDKLLSELKNFNKDETISKYKFNKDTIKQTLIKRLLELVKNIHFFGITHLDIKPVNVLVNKSLELKFIDFGLSCMNIDTGCRITKSSKYYYYPYSNTSLLDRYLDTIADRILVDFYSVGICIYKILSLSSSVPTNSKLIEYLKQPYANLISKTPDRIQFIKTLASFYTIIFRSYVPSTEDEIIKDRLQSCKHTWRVHNYLCTTHATDNNLVCDNCSQYQCCIMQQSINKYLKYKKKYLQLKKILSL